MLQGSFTVVTGSTPRSLPVRHEMNGYPGEDFAVRP
jgi:hypothetical protein